MATTGPDTSSIALKVASFGVIPCSMWCMTASTTTIASSTTMPIASTRPSSESTLIEKPSSGKKMNAPTSETGTVSSGISVARQFCRNTNTTMMTSTIASNSVVTDLADALHDRQRRVERDRVVHVPREPRLQVLQRLLDVAGDLEGVRARDLEDGDDGGGLAVVPADGVVELGPELDAGDVLERDLRPVGVGADDDLAEFLLVQEAPLRAHGVGVLGAGHRRRAADLARRRSAVLLR